MRQQQSPVRKTPVLDTINQRFIEKLSAKAEPPIYTLTMFLHMGWL